MSSNPKERKSDISAKDEKKIRKAFKLKVRESLKLDNRKKLTDKNIHDYIEQLFLSFKTKELREGTWKEKIVVLYNYYHNKEGKESKIEKNDLSDDVSIEKKLNYILGFFKISMFRSWLNYLNNSVTKTDPETKKVIAVISEYCQEQKLESPEDSNNKQKDIDEKESEDKPKQEQQEIIKTDPKEIAKDDHQVIPNPVTTDENESGDKETEKHDTPEISNGLIENQTISENKDTEKVVAAGESSDKETEKHDTAEISNGLTEDKTPPENKDTEKPVTTVPKKDSDKETVGGCNEPQPQNKPKWKIIIVTLIIISIVIVVIVNYFTEIKSTIWPGIDRFDVIQNYDFKNKMGDIGDLSQLTNKNGICTFRYITNGQGPHEWDYKYLSDNSNNTRPAGFAGLIWLHPANNFGITDGGYDLSNFRKRITWEVKCAGKDTVWTEFKIGGIKWNWKGTTKAASPYQDSMDELSFGCKPVTQKWQEFEFNLENIPESRFQKVLGGFMTVISWDNNGIISDSMGRPIKPDTFDIQVRNIFYHRK